MIKMKCENCTNRATLKKRIKYFLYGKRKGLCIHGHHLTCSECKSILDDLVAGTKIPRNILMGEERGIIQGSDDKNEPNR